MQAAYALRDIGEPHLGAAALICFEWHQRPEHVRTGNITGADWRPPERPDTVQVGHPKTGIQGWVPLEDKRGKLFPEIEAYLAELPRLGVPIVLTAGRRGPAKTYSSEYAQRKVREARQGRPRRARDAGCMPARRLDRVRRRRGNRVRGHGGVNAQDTAGTAALCLAIGAPAHGRRTQASAAG